MTQPDRPSPWRRIAAYFIDYGVILLYLALLTGAMVLLDSLVAVSLGDIQSVAVKQLVITLTLTIPVVLYFAIMETAPRGATVGKRIMHLTVRTAEGRPAPFRRTLARGVVKFLPWELAHTVIWRIPSGSDEAVTFLPWQSASLAVVALACMSYVMSLFIAHGRTPYDYLAGTRVVEVSR